MSCISSAPRATLGADTTIRSNYMLGGRTIAVRVVESNNQTSDEVSYIHSDHASASSATGFDRLSLRVGSNTVMSDDTGAKIAGSDARHEAQSGRSVDNIVFYYVYGLFKLGVIVQQIYRRWKLGYSKDPRFGAMT